MDINSTMYEVENIDKELKRIQNEIKGLKKRRDTLISAVVQEMKNRDETEFTYKGKKYTLQEMTRRTRKGDKKKREEAITLLQQAGINGEDASLLYKDLASAFAGIEKTVFRLKS